MLALLAQVPPTEPIDTPEVAWSGLMPLLILSGSAVVLLTIMSVAKGALPRVFSAVYAAAAGAATIVAAIPLWLRVQDDERGPFSTLSSAVGIDGFSVFVTMLIASVVMEPFSMCRPRSKIRCAVSRASCRLPSRRSATSRKMESSRKSQTTSRMVSSSTRQVFCERR